MSSFISVQISRIRRLFWLLLAMVIRSLVKVDRKSIFFWSYNFKQYACSPKYLCEYILKKHPGEYRLYWGLNHNVDTSSIPEGVTVVRHCSLKYLIALYRSKFIVNNMRNFRMDSFFFKKKEQKYLMCWHGSIALKKIEKDVEKQLGEYTCNVSKKDSQDCDLMMAGSLFFHDIIRNAFWYDGEIYDGGAPRDDVLFDPDFIRSADKKVRQYYGIKKETVIVLYAPTFRSDYSITHFKLEWNRVIEAFSQLSEKPCMLLLRLHPNMIGKFDEKDLNLGADVIDCTKFLDMQELLASADYLITDYSSSMFDFSIMGKPCFLYADDKGEYDRGFYFKLDELPFVLSETQPDLLNNIIKFDVETYNQRVNDFYNEKIRLWAKGNACRDIFNWIKNNS